MVAEPITAEVETRIASIVEEHDRDKDALIEILHSVQSEIGYLPQDVQECIAAELDMPAGVIESVISFYSFFTTVPRGRHIIKVCQGTACYVRGGKRVLEAVSKHCACEVGETTEDMRYSLDIVRCIGACGLAPVMTVDDDIYERAKPTKVGEVLDKYE